MNNYHKKNIQIKSYTTFFIIVVFIFTCFTYKTKSSVFLLYLFIIFFNDFFIKYSYRQIKKGSFIQKNLANSTFSIT